MEIPMDTSKMSEQELQFHYFKMHDADNNNKLDGCELIKSLIHWHGRFIVYFSISTILLSISTISVNKIFSVDMIFQCLFAIALLQ